MAQVEKAPPKAAIKNAIEQTEKAQQKFGSKKGTSILDSDTWVRWSDLVNEHSYDRCIMASNKEIRDAYNACKKSGTAQARGMTKGRHYRHVARIPTWLWLRMEVLTQDPEFWKDDGNLKKVLEAYPEYALVDINTI